MTSAHVIKNERTPAVATGAQIREARRLLQWGSAFLAKKAGVSLQAIVEAQLEDSLRPMDPAVIRVALRAAQQALEAAGVEFIPENGGGARVRLRKGAP